MTKDQNEQDILKRLKELEAENARLRASQNKEKPKLVVTEGDYKGHPVLTFEGPVRRFSLGLTKLRVLKEAWPQIEIFLSRNHGANVEDDDIKI